MQPAALVEVSQGPEGFGQDPRGGCDPDALDVGHEGLARDGVQGEEGDPQTLWRARAVPVEGVRGHDVGVVEARQAAELVAEVALGLFGVAVAPDGLEGQGGGLGASQEISDEEHAAQGSPAQLSLDGITSVDDVPQPRVGLEGGRDAPVV